MSKPYMYKPNIKSVVKHSCKPSPIQPKKARSKPSRQAPKPHVARKAPRRSKPSQAVVEVISTGTPSIQQYDVNAMLLVMEAIVAHYAMTTDIFTEITPQQLVHYLFMLAGGFFSQTGASLVNAWAPTNIKNVQWALPYAFAKFLEYNAPYSNKGISANFRLTTNGFSTDATNPNVGLGGTSYPRPTWFPPHTFFPQSTVQASTVGSGPQQVNFTMEPNTNQTWNQFVVSNATIDKVSNALSKRGNTIPLSKVPLSAPDSSAYSALAGAVNDAGTTDLNNVLGIDTNYDPELTMFLSPTNDVGVELSTTTSKSYPRPTFQISGVPCPDSYYVASVWVFVAQTYKGAYKRGKFKDVFTFNGKKLVTLYPQEHPVNGIGLGNQIQAFHKQILASKGLDGTADPNSTNLTVINTVAYAAQQSRLNQVEVLHLQCPSISAYRTQDSAGPFKPAMIPQFFYIDKALGSSLPAPIAAAISSIGPVVVDGALRIPVSSYDLLPTKPAETLEDDTTIGPIRWSSRGYQDGNAGLPNQPVALDVPIVANVTVLPADAPNIMWDDTPLTPYIANVVFSLDWYGGQNVISYNFGGLEIELPTNVYPCFPTAGAATCIQNAYLTWLQQNMYSQNTTLVPVNSSPAGDLSTMTSAISLDKDEMTRNKTQPGDADSPYMNISVAPSSISTSYPLDVVSAGHAGMNLQGISGTASSSPAPQKSRYRQMVTNLAVGASLDTIPDSGTLGGPYTTDIPWSTGKAGVIAGLAQHFSSTANPFHDAATKAQSTDDYDVVSLFKQHAGSIFRKSFSGTNKRVITANRFYKEAHDVINKPKKQGKKKKRGIKGAVDGVLDDVGKAGEHLVKFGVDSITGQLKQLPKQAEQAVSSMF